MMDKPLCRKRIQSVLADRHHFISDGQRGMVQNGYVLNVAVHAKSKKKSDVICWNCLKAGHVANQCKSKTVCTRCWARGHRFKQSLMPPGAAAVATDSSIAVELSNMTVEVFNEEVWRAGRTKDVYVSCVNN